MSGSAAKVGIVISAQDDASKTIADLQKRLKELEGKVGGVGKRLNEANSKSDGLRKLGTGMRDLGRESLGAFQNIGRIVTPLGLITGAASIGGLAQLTERWAQMGARLGFAAQRAGVTTSQLSGLQGAARLAGSSAESLTSGLTSLSDNLTNAAAGRAPEAIMAFNYLGVSVRDATGKVRTANDALPELADRIAGIRNPTIQAQVATMLFGGAAEDLLPFLRMGSAGIKEYTDKAREYGAINDRASAAANELRKKQVELTLAVEGVGNSIAEHLEPVLGPMILDLATWLKNNRDLIGTDVAGWIKDAVPAAQAFAKDANAVAEALGGWKNLLEAVIAINVAGWAAGVVAKFVPILRLLALVPGSGVTAAMLAGAGIAFEGGKSQGTGIAAAGEAGLRPGLVEPETGRPIYYLGPDGKMYTPDEAERLSKNRVFPGEGGMEAPTIAPANQSPGVAPSPPNQPGSVTQWLQRNVPWLAGPSTPPPTLPGGAPGASGGDPRGIRNNNPLNLGYVPGQQGAIGTDGRFGVYASMEAGVAQANRQLLLYQDRDHLLTLRQMISKWAPNNENNTAAYIASVAGRIGVNPDQQINMRDPATARGVIAAMARVETGREIDAGAIERGVQAVLGGAPVQVAQARGPSAQVGGGTGAGTSAAKQETTVRGSAKIDVRFSVFPEGTRTLASTDGDLFGRPKIETVPLGMG